jgi:cbb3-type cytochrome oxidase subunit 3
VTHTLDDIYVVLLLILVVLVVWFMFSNILKIVKIFTYTRWK